jgi:hypothetical protein
MTILSTYLCRDCRFLAEDKFLVTFEHQSGQGPETILLLAETDTAYDLGSSYSLDLVPTTPTMKPVLEPHLEPLAVPFLKPVATPGRVPELLTPPPLQGTPQATPFLVPQATPYPIPQATPYLVPPGYAVPQPMVVPPLNVPQLQEPSALANQAYIAARYEAAAHAQMAAELAAMKARYEAPLGKTGKPAKALTPEDVKALEEVIEAHKRSKEGTDWI